MAVREIRVFGDPVLRSECKPVTEITDGVRALVQDLLDTVDFPGRAGVAATQIGYSVQAFSLRIDEKLSYVLNPVLETAGELSLVGEGCLSVPDIWHETPRYPWARVTGIDLDGKEVVLEGEGLMAQALQHECDHLKGMLYLQRLEPETRRLAMRQVRESAWF